MVEYRYADLFAQDNVDKQLTIKTDDGLVTITNTELHQEQFELSESLCSESQLRFGCCEASSIKFKISNVFTPLNGKWLTVTETLDGNTDVSFLFGKYKVNSDKPTADRTCRDVVAYDAMYDIINSDVADWYNTILPDKTSTVALKEFRTSFAAHFGLEQEEIDLVNDSMVVDKTIEPSEISGKYLLTAICAINGCFGHIARDGKLRYVLLPQGIQGLYPADNLYPADDLYPRDPKSTRLGKGLYISAQYEDFITKSITKLQIRQEENDIGYIAGSGDNCYIVQDNFLVYGKSTDDLKVIAENLLSVIRGVIYRPFEADVKGNPCMEVGDPVRLTTKHELIESYILKRTLKGVQALRDDYSADGVEEYSEKVNSVQKSIIQLKGKTNTLTRTVEETKSEIKDVERGLSSRITQNAESITAEVSRATSAEGTLSSRIAQTAESITLEVTRAKNAENSLSSRITQTAESITAEVTRATEAEETLSSRIVQTAESITAEVSRAKDAEGTLSGKIALLPSSISLSVSNNSTTAGIEIKVTDGNGNTTKSTGTIKMTGLVSFTNLSTSGETTINGANIQTGTITAEKISVSELSSLGATIGGFNISKTKIYGTSADGHVVVVKVPTSGSYVFAAGGTSHDSYSDCPFRVKYDGTMYATNATVAGKITATSGTIGGCKIEDGTLKIKNANIEEISADIIKTGTLSTDRLNLSELNAKYVRTENFTADYISALGITVSSANVTGGFSASKITSGTIDTDRLNVNEIASRFSSSNNIDVGGLNAKSVVSTSLSISGGASILGKTVSWKSVTIGSTTIKYLGYDE